MNGNIRLNCTRGRSLLISVIWPASISDPGLVYLSKAGFPWGGVLTGRVKKKLNKNPPKYRRTNTNGTATIYYNI